MWVEVGKSACVLVISLRDVDCASLLLLDMTRINPTYGLSLSGQLRISLATLRAQQRVLCNMVNCALS